MAPDTETAKETTEWKTGMQNAIAVGKVVAGTGWRCLRCRRRFALV